MEIPCKDKVILSYLILSYLNSLFHNLSLNEKRNNLDELINIPIKVEERFVVQISFKRHNPESASIITTDPRSTVFSKSANLRDLPHKSTILALFKAKSVDPTTYSPPSSWVPRCRRAFSSLFLWNFRLFYSFNWCKPPFSPVDSSLIHVQRKSTSLILGGFLSDALDALLPLWSK